MSMKIGIEIDNDKTIDRLSSVGGNKKESKKNLS